MVKEGLAESEQGLKELRDMPISPIKISNQKFEVCYGEKKPGERDQELKKLVNVLGIIFGRRNVKWRFESRKFWPLEINPNGQVTSGVWLVQGEIDY